LENDLFSYITTKLPDNLNINMIPNLSPSQTPCNSNSKNFFLLSNFSTNANTTNNSKLNSNRKYHSPEIDSKISSIINFQGGSPKILNTHYSGANLQSYNSNGSGNITNNLNNIYASLKTAINNTNTNIANMQQQFPYNPVPFIGNSNSKNFSLNFSNINLNTNANINNNDLNSQKKNMKKETKSNEKELKNDKEFYNFNMIKPKRPNSSAAKKINNKQLQIKINPNLIPSINRNSFLNIPSTTIAKNNLSININQRQKIVNDISEDSNESIRDIIRNLNEEKLNFNFFKKTEKPITFKFSEKIDKMKKMQSGNVSQNFST